MTESYDAIVLGLGAMGAAAAYQLARRGAKVLGIDRYAPPHDQGSTHGDTRITRIACGEGPEYSAFARRSHEIWRELEAETGLDLLTQNGFLAISGAGERSANHGVAKFLDATAAAARSAGVKYEILDGATLRRRYPAFGVADGDQAYHDAVGGFARPENCVTAQLRAAAARGADLRSGETVVSFVPHDGSVTVTTDKQTYRAAQLIVAAGAWLPAMLKPALAANFMVTRQVLYWFRARSEAAHAEFAPDRFPVYIWQLPAPQSIYGFPATGGIEEGVKLATEQYDVATTPESVSRTVPPEEVREMYETYVEPFFPSLSPVCVRSKTCLYTWVDKARFIIDRHPDHDRVIVASPCSGHGFKHSAGVGELLSQMALEGKKPDPRFAFR
ncbi:MAG: N-methyl-L-tryptophan oxidase [Reyranella sp.]|nr:N-methyl-L-tryptophan oxidase [Reyranella sp.]MBL6651040.1 N-methyl-L-tryptophan oxidase [Reyranella sp.]